MKPKNPVQMAVIGAAHGIRCELRVKTFTGDPLALGHYGPLFAEDADEGGRPDQPGRFNPKARPRGPKSAGGNR